jgi:delta8-fatty-acid desaturase
MAFFLHDASHNEVTRIRKIDNILSYIIANVLGGISVGLWKDEHQTHHVVTNHVEHDPDIQLIPFVAITSKYFKSVYSSFHGRELTFNSFSQQMVKFQHILGYFYIPFFKMALYLFAPFFLIFNPRSRNMKKELALTSIYYIWLYYLLSHFPTFNLAAFYFFTNNMMTSIVFLQIVLAHLAMNTDPYTDSEEFFIH